MAVALGLGDGAADVAAATGADRVGVGACAPPELAELGPRVFTTSAMTPRATTAPPRYRSPPIIPRRRCARWYPYRSPPGASPEPFGRRARPGLPTRRRRGTAPGCRCRRAPAPPPAAHRRRYRQRLHRRGLDAARLPGPLHRHWLDSGRLEGC